MRSIAASEEDASPAQKFRVLSVEPAESDMDALLCMQYIKRRADKYRAWAREERAAVNETGDTSLKLYHLREEMKHQAAADALESLLDAMDQMLDKGCGLK